MQNSETRLGQLQIVSKSACNGQMAEESDIYSNMRPSGPPNWTVYNIY